MSQIAIEPHHVEGRVLKVTDLQKTFGAALGQRVGLKGLSFEAYSGRVLAILGKNGAGKTTLARILTGLLVKEAGQVDLDGRSLFGRDGWPNAVGSLFEGTKSLYGKLTVAENIDYFGALAGMSSTEARNQALPYFDRFLLSDLQNTLVSRLSRGQRQKTALIVGLMRRPAIVILDEPTLGLDHEAATELANIIHRLREYGCIVLLMTHELSLAQTVSDDTLIIQDGRSLRHAKTADLLEEFSTPLLEIRADASEMHEVRHKLENDYQVSLDGDVMMIKATERDFYAIADLIRPTPVQSVSRVRPSLDYVMKIIGAS